VPGAMIVFLMLKKKLHPRNILSSVKAGLCQKNVSCEHLGSRLLIVSLDHNLSPL